MSNREDKLLVIGFILLIASLIRTEFIPVLSFVVGFYLSLLNKKEKWLEIK